MPRTIITTTPRKETTIGHEWLGGSWRFNSEGAVGLTAGQTNGNAWNLRPNDAMYALRIGGNRAVPEPATLLLALLGLVLSYCARSRRQQSDQS